MVVHQSQEAPTGASGADTIGYVIVEEGASLAAWAVEDARAAQEEAQAATKTERATADAKGTAEHHIASAKPYFIDDDDSRTRRLFGQEFVTQLKRIGAGNAKHLYDDGMSFFACRPRDQGTIDYIGNMAQRYGWATQTDGVWTVTETGNSLTPPPSLAVRDVLTRMFRLAEPMRTNATNCPRPQIFAAQSLSLAADRKTSGPNRSTQRRSSLDTICRSVISRRPPRKSLPPRSTVQPRIRRGQLPRENAAVVQGCVPLISTA